MDETNELPDLADMMTQDEHEQTGNGWVRVCGSGSEEDGPRVVGNVRGE